MDQINLLKAKNGIRVNLANYFSVSPSNNVWGPRVIQDHELIYLLQGHGRYRESNAPEVSLSEGEVLLIPPGIEHLFACDKGLPSAISCMHFSYVDGFTANEYGVFKTGQDYEIHHLFRKCAAEFTSRKENYQEILDSNAREIFIRIQRSSHAVLERKEPTTLSRARSYLLRCIDRSVTRGELARHLDITPEHLNLLFRKFHQDTPMRYLTKLRMQKAMELLTTAGTNVSQTAYQTGYKDPLHFSRVFKRYVGVSPSEYASRV